MVVIVVCAVMFFIGRGLAWCVNKLARRHLLNTAAVGTICTLPWSLGPLYGMITDKSAVLQRLSPEQQGELVASFVLPSVLVIALGTWLAFREAKAQRS